MSEPTSSSSVPDADVLLCRKIVQKAGVPGKEAECVTALKAFGKDGDFDKSVSELSKILSKTPQEVMSLASEALGPKPMPAPTPALGAKKEQ